MKPNPETTAEPAAAPPPKAGPVPPTKTADARKRTIAIGAGVAAVLVGAAVVFGGGGRKEEFAQRQLAQARAAGEMGDLANAASGFQGVIESYGGTDAAQDAVIGLNQVRLINGQNELAVTGLREFIASKPDAEFIAPAFGLLGAALENARRPAEAADAYRNAAGAADVDYLRASYLVQAARALMAAGRRDEAAQTLRDVIARYPETPMTTEAEVRLAELTAGRM